MLHMVWEKNEKNIVIIFIIVLFISACGIDTKTEYKTDAARSVQTDTDEMYKFLNQNLLGKDFLKYIGEDLIVRGVCDYSEEVKGEFVPIINEKSNFPEELVVMLEEALYHSSNVMTRGNESAYMEMLNALGAEEFMSNGYLDVGAERYGMNVVLLNKDKVNQLGTYVLLPQRVFVLKEGEVFTTAG